MTGNKISRDRIKCLNYRNLDTTRVEYWDIWTVLCVSSSDSVSDSVGRDGYAN